MSKFYSRSNVPDRIPTPSGDMEAPIYGIEYDSNGRKKVIIKGMEDRYAAAQVFKDQCDVNNIIKRYTEGDALALERVKTFYGDFTNSPKSLLEAMNIVQNGREAFSKLPLEIREAYNHDPDQFIADIGSEKFKKLMNPEPPDYTIGAKEEVKVDG